MFQAEKFFPGYSWTVGGRSPAEKVYSDVLLDSLVIDGLCLVYTGLSAEDFQFLWAGQSLIPESWKDRGSQGEVRYLVFDSTVLSHHGHEAYVAMYWSRPGHWEYRLIWRKGKNPYSAGPIS